MPEVGQCGGFGGHQDCLVRVYGGALVPDPFQDPTQDLGWGKMVGGRFGIGGRLAI